MKSSIFLIFVFLEENLKKAFQKCFYSTNKQTFLESEAPPQAEENNNNNPIFLTSSSISFAQSHDFTQAGAKTAAETAAKLEAVTSDLYKKDSLIGGSSLDPNIETDDPFVLLNDNIASNANPTNNILMPSDQNDCLDFEDQSDEKRAHKSREGVCFFSCEMDPFGIFWINPTTLPPDVKKCLNDLTNYMESFVPKTRLSSYGELHLTPEQNKRCFVRYRNPKGAMVWKRGLIEAVINNGEYCRVRLLDNGSCRHKVSLEDIFPHRRLDHAANKINYVAIRCCVTDGKNEQNLYSSMVINFTRAIVSEGTFRFKLLNQIVVNGQKCWRVDLTFDENNSGYNFLRKRFLKKHYFNLGNEIAHMVKNEISQKSKLNGKKIIFESNLVMNNFK